MEAFIEEIMPGDEVKITVGRAGERGAVNEDVRQHTHVVNSDEDKLSWLLQELPGMIDEGDVLIFGGTRIRWAIRMRGVDENETLASGHGLISRFNHKTAAGWRRSQP